MCIVWGKHWAKLGLIDQIYLADADLGLVFFALRVLDVLIRTLGLSKQRLRFAAS